MALAPYSPEAYWTQRFSRGLTLDAVGYRGLGRGMNRWIYRRRLAVLRALLRRHDLRLAAMRVAELGVGSGYWVEEWHRSGVREMFGFDITQVAVDELSRRYPAYRFAQCDIGVAGSATAHTSGARFDLVVAMEVLLHITDRGQFERALDNLADLAAPGAHVVLSDLFLPVEVAAYHQVSRTLSRYEALMQSRGFHLEDSVPVFFTLHPSDFTRRGARRWIATQRWHVISKALRLIPGFGWPLGAALFAVDSALGAVLREGPSTHMTLWRRT